MASNKDELAYTAKQVRSLATRLNLRANMLHRLGKELQYLYGLVGTQHPYDVDGWQYAPDIVAQAQATLSVVADTLADINGDAQALDELLGSVGEVDE